MTARPKLLNSSTYYEPYSVKLELLQSDFCISMLPTRQCRLASTQFLKRRRFGLLTWEWVGDWGHPKLWNIFSGRYQSRGAAQNLTRACDGMCRHGPRTLQTKNEFSWCIQDSVTTIRYHSVKSISFVNQTPIPTSLQQWRHWSTDLPGVFFFHVIFTFY